MGSLMPVTSKAQEAVDYPFLEYASTNWFKHTKYINKKETEVWRLFGQLVQKPAQNSQREPWHSNQWKIEALDGFPNHDDSRSECFSDVLRSQMSGKTIGIDPPPVTLPEFSHVLLAFIYAEFNGHRALACRSFRLLIGLHTFSDGLNKLVCILMANKNHMVCQNDCADFAPPDLDHRYLIEELRKAIVRGILYFPALRRHMLGLPCNCADSSPLESRRDICNVIAAGYWQATEPHLQAFAIMEEELKIIEKIPTISDLAHICLVEEGALTEARNIHGMLLFDVLIQRIAASRSSHWKEFLLAPAGWKSLAVPIARFMEYIPTPMFPHTLDVRDAHSSLSRLPPIEYTMCFIVLLEEGIRGEAAPKNFQIRQYALSGTMIQLHGETITTIFRTLVIPTLWQTEMATYIVKTLFYEHPLPAPKHIMHAYKDCFQEAVLQNNWDIAAALAQHQLVSAYGAIISGHFASIRQALLCDSCWRRTQNKRLTSSDMLQYSFHLCSNHNFMFEKIPGFFKGIHDADRQTLLFPEHNTDSLLEWGIRFKRA